MENKPIYSIVFSRKTEKELVLSFDWYEKQQMGLGTKFLETVLLWFQKIEKNPELFSLKHKSFREAKIATFPFVVIYQIHKKKNIVRVVSVFHTAQSPLKKYK